MPYMVDRHPLHGDHVSLAGHDALAAELSLRRLKREHRARDGWPRARQADRRRAPRRNRARRDLGRGLYRVPASSASPRSSRESQAFAHLDREHALAQARALDERRLEGRPLGPLHGIPVGDQGHLRHRATMPTEIGSPLDGRPPAARRRHRGGEAARRRRGHHRQDGDHRVRLFPSGQDPQSARRRAHAGRLVVGIGRRGRRRHGAARARQPDQRLGHPPRRLLRRVRHQADARPHLACRRADAVAQARSCRRVCALARRPGARSSR